jgi:signal transduction histidine kinase
MRRKRAEVAIGAARDAAQAALRELQTAQASPVHAQKMAALGQLTAGIVHEIKNPLNFVNNFSALSIELADELLNDGAGYYRPASRALCAADHHFLQPLRLIHASTANIKMNPSKR